MSRSRLSFPAAKQALASAQVLISEQLAVRFLHCEVVMPLKTTVATGLLVLRSGDESVLGSLVDREEGDPELRTNAKNARQQNISIVIAITGCAAM